MNKLFLLLTSFLLVCTTSPVHGQETSQKNPFDIFEDRLRDEVEDDIRQINIQLQLNGTGSIENTLDKNVNSFLNEIETIRNDLQEEGLLLKPGELPKGSRMPKSPINNEVFIPVEAPTYKMGSNKEKENPVSLD